MRITTPIDDYLSRDVKTVRITVKSLGNEYSLKVRDSEKDMSLVLPDLAIVYEICADIYRKAIKEGKRVIFRDRDTTLTLKQGDLVVFLNLSERQDQITRDMKRMRASRLKFGRTPTRKVKRHDPKAMYPYEKTW
jgi:hypothetical protein